MSFAASFGGFGDFVTLVQLIHNTYNLVKACCHATKARSAVLESFTRFKDSLDLLMPVFMTLIAMLPEEVGTLNPSQIEVLARTGQTILDAIDECREAIQSFSLKATHGELLRKRPVSEEEGRLFACCWILNNVSSGVTQRRSEGIASAAQ